jgi:hypothetical protein
MALSDLEGFLDSLTDTEMLMETGKAAAGGMLGGALVEVATAKIKFLREGTENVVMLKSLGARLGMSVLFAALLGESQESLAKGYVGGAMAGFGPELLRRFAPEALTPLQGYYPLANSFAGQPRRALAGTRTYSKGNIPAGVAGGGLRGVRVGRPFPGLASISAGGGGF